MVATIKALFPSRREVELAVEHLVQEYGIERTDIFIDALGLENSSGTSAAGADFESSSSGHPATAEGAAYEGHLQVSVDMNEDETDAVTAAFHQAGALEVSGT